MTKPYFHEQPYEQVKQLTVEEVKSQFAQPNWCGYPDALDSLGCWGLTYGFVTAQGKEYCVKCELNKENVQAQKQEVTE